MSEAVSRRSDDGAWLKGATDYSIDHLPSGTHIWAVPMGQQKLAKGIVIELLALEGVNWEHRFLAFTPEQVRQMWEVCHPPPKPRPKLLRAKKEPLTFQSVYPPHFAPSEELRLYDGLNEKDLNAGRWPRYIREAANLLGKEVALARFTVGRKAPLSPEDVYDYANVKGSRAFAAPDLPPGFPGGYEGCRRIIEGLWKLGTLIDALADAMIAYWETVEQVDESLWLDWERQFREYVIKGWGNWALAASLFEGLPRADKAKITGKLGYVGGLRQGYHPLGLKTFLRSKRLPRLREIRRLRKWGVEREYEALEDDDGIGQE